MYHGERFNAWTHLLGGSAAIVGAGWLIYRASDHSHTDAPALVSLCIYALTLVLLYTASTLYHSVQGPLKNVLRKIDHLSIYLMIAGSYTPFCLITLRHWWGWEILAAIWCVALVGMLQELHIRSKARTSSMVIYGLMGWGMAFAIEPLIAELGTTGFMWLLAGGILYSIGVIFFLLDERFPYFHGIWHLFVIAGSSVHYLTVLFFVLPRAHTL